MATSKKDAIRELALATAEYEACATRAGELLAETPEMSKINLDWLAEAMRNVERAASRVQNAIVVVQCAKGE